MIYIYIFFFPPFFVYFFYTYISIHPHMIFLCATGNFKGRYLEDDFHVFYGFMLYLVANS